MESNSPKERVYQRWILKCDAEIAEVDHISTKKGEEGGKEEEKEEIGDDGKKEDEIIPTFKVLFLFFVNNLGV